MGRAYEHAFACSARRALPNQLVMKLVENDSSYDEDHKAHLAIMGVDRCVVDKNGEIDESVLEAVKDRLTRLMFE